MNKEKRKLYKSLRMPIILVVLIWLVKLVEVVFNIRLGYLGIKPLSAEGLIGVITSPLVHADFSHLMANTLPLFLLSAGLFYFYRKIAYTVFILIYLITGIWVWVFARDAYHIGASGIVYGLASFLFFSGVFRKDMHFAAISLVIAFVYGGMLWGILPLKAQMSWESHLMGLIAGLVIAYFFRNDGPKRKKYQWEVEEEMEKQADKKRAKQEQERRDYQNFERELEAIKRKYIYKDDEDSGRNKK